MKTSLTMYAFPDGKRTPVGFVFTLGDTPWGQPVILTRVWVMDRYRGQGHGKALLKAITNQADRENKDLLLSVQPDPDMDFNRIVKLYESFGFKMQNDGTTMHRKYVHLPKAAEYAVV